MELSDILNVNWANISQEIILFLYCCKHLSLYSPQPHIVKLFFVFALQMSKVVSEYYDNVIVLIINSAVHIFIWFLSVSNFLWFFIIA